MTDPLFPDEEPTPEIMVMARNLRQMFVALLQTGFTENQAMYVIGITISTAAAGSHPLNPPQ